MALLLLLQRALVHSVLPDHVPEVVAQLGLGAEPLVVLPPEASHAVLGRGQVGVALVGAQEGGVGTEVGVLLAVGQQEVVPDPASN